MVSGKNELGSCVHACGRPVVRGNVSADLVNVKSEVAGTLTVSKRASACIPVALKLKSSMLEE